MKEFDKWLENQCDELLKMGLEFHVFDPINSAKRAWRAALKWSKAMHDVSSEPRFSVNIEEELEDG